MAVWPFSYTEETSIADEENTFLGGGRTGITGKRQRKIKIKTVREWLQDALVFLSGIRLNSGRIAFQELTSGTLSTSGWYTIAEISNSPASQECSGFLVLSSATNAETVMLKYSLRASNTPNIVFEIISKASFSPNFAFLKNFRFAYGSSSSGCKVQFETDGGLDVTTELIGNSSRGSNHGLELVTPYLDDESINPSGQVTLPDGVTPATFIEAGAEFDFSSSPTRFIAGVTARRSNDNSIRVELYFEDIPKQSAIIALTQPTILMRFYDGTGSFTTVSSPTFGAPEIRGKIVSFDFNETNIGLGLNSGGLSILAQGSGGKFTL